MESDVALAPTEPSEVYCRPCTGLHGHAHTMHADTGGLLTTFVGRTLVGLLLLVTTIVAAAKFLALWRPSRAVIAAHSSNQEVSLHIWWSGTVAVDSSTKQRIGLELFVGQ